MKKLKLNKDMGKVVIAHGYKLDAKEKYYICFEDELEEQISMATSFKIMGLSAINDYSKWLKDNDFNISGPTKDFVSSYFSVKPLWITDLSQGIVVKNESDDDYYIIMECSRKNVGFQYAQIVIGCI